MSLSAPKLNLVNRPHLVFDVNETLLDLAPLDAVFDDLFGEPGLRQRWFSTLLQWSMVSTLTGRYRDFSLLGGDSLNALAQRRSVVLTDAQRAQLLDCIATLPPHPDVLPALGQLRDAGFCLLALTNSPQRTVDAQFAHAGLTPLFDQVLSVDGARVFKPHPDAYALAASAMQCGLSDLCLIAAHDWDVTGALRAGCTAALVARDGALAHPAGEAAPIVGADMHAVAQQLIDRYAAR